MLDIVIKLLFVFTTWMLRLMLMLMVPTSYLCHVMDVTQKEKRSNITPPQILPFFCHGIAFFVELQQLSTLVGNTPLSAPMHNVPRQDATMVTFGAIPNLDQIDLGIHLSIHLQHKNLEIDCNVISKDFLALA
jgi:hypothetical protein